MSENNTIFNFYIYMFYIILASEVIGDKEPLVRYINKSGSRI